MPIERQLQLFNEMLNWASEMYDDFELYEWCRICVVKSADGRTVYRGGDDYDAKFVKYL